MSLILKQFEKNIVEGKFSRDTAQEEAVESLSLLQDRVTLKHNRKINHFLKGLLNKAKHRASNIVDLPAPLDPTISVASASSSWMSVH